MDLQKKIKCLIVDDENLALDILEEYIKQIDFLDLMGRCNTAVEAYNILNKNTIDILFIDIQMPEMTGIEFVKNLIKPPKVIFTTAYREYALEGYDLNATDYLLKPISFQRFIKSVNKVMDLLASKAEAPAIEIKSKENIEEPFFYVKSQKKMIKIVVNDIQYIESLTSFVHIYTNNEKIICYKSISEFEKSLDKYQFIRIHRSFLVALKFIKAFTANHVEISGKSLPIGRLYKNEVYHKLNQYSS